MYQNRGHRVAGVAGGRGAGHESGWSSNGRGKAPSGSGGSEAGFAFNCHKLEQREYGLNTPTGLLWAAGWRADCGGAEPRSEATAMTQTGYDGA